MRKFIYLSLIDRLKQLKDEAGEPAIRTFDLWNEQVEFIEQEEAFDTPAVFIEFMPLKWTNLSGGCQQANATLRLHIVTTWNGSARDGSVSQRQTLGRFDLLDSIDRLLFNAGDRCDTASFCMLRRSGSTTNHNHEELVEDISDYTCLATENIKTG